MKLEGRSALVTGAGSGIGRAIARLFAAEGASVLVAELNEETGAAAAREIEDAGGRARFLRADTGREEDVKAAIAATVEAWGRLDAVVNNAGIVGPAYTWEQVIAVNLSGVYYGCLHGLEAMKGQGGGGTIINMASMAGLVGFSIPGLPEGFGSPSGNAYIAAKHGVLGITKQFALDGAPHGVRVNAICPGWIDTPLIAPLTQTAPLLEWALQGTPLGRLGQPEEIAKAALFLASDDSSFMTGAPLIIDGGWTAR
ncbi:MAG: SDR family NAD(P)-dependent oxidoreductase [Dehalococcoidia bacterium]|nr:SDR family NAD(P)-dependent oxidoreductase [Dehalococcoidia bacterium]